MKVAKKRPLEGDALGVVKAAKNSPLEDEAAQIGAEVEVLDVINVQPPLANGELIKLNKNSWALQANGELIKSNKNSWSPQLEKGDAERKPGRRAGQPRKWV